MKKTKRTIWEGEFRRKETDREYWTRQAKGWGSLTAIYLGVTTFCAYLPPGDFGKNLLTVHGMLLSVAALFFLVAKSIKHLDF